MGDIPFVAFGDDELEGCDPIKDGDIIKCPECARMHVVECGIDNKTGQKTDLLLFYNCGEKSYLVGVAGKNVMPLRNRRRKK